MVLESFSQQSKRSGSKTTAKLQLIWGATMYHVDDLPFHTSNLPDVYTQFRKARLSHFLSLRTFEQFPLHVACSASLSWICL